MKQIIPILIVAATGLACLTTGCSTTRPEPVEPVARGPIDFNQAERPHNLDRGALTAQNAVSLANWTWANKGSRADYFLSANALASTLRRGDYRNTEERMRLAVMCLQHGLLAADNDSLRTASAHWAAAYKALDRVTYEGELETYVAAQAALGAPVDRKLLSRTNPEIANLIKE